MSGLRSWLYLAARLIGDANAIAKGRIVQRLIRKAVYRETSKLIQRSIR